MIQFTVETEIARPPTEVFSYVTDPTKLSTWQTNTVSAVAEDDQPLGLGTRLREVHRAPGGKQLVSLAEVSAYEPDRVFALRMLEGALPIDARVTYASSSSVSSPATAPCSNDCSRTPRPRDDRAHKQVRDAALRKREVAKLALIVETAADV